MTSATPSRRDCPHGSQSGKCYVCDCEALERELQARDATIAELRKQLATHRGRIERLRGMLKTAAGWLFSLDQIVAGKQYIKFARPLPDLPETVEHTSIYPPDDIFSWSDGTWCYRSEVGDKLNKPHVMVIIEAHTKAWDDFIQKHGG